MTSADALSHSDFERLANLVHTHCGIRLGAHKKAMLIARLSKHMRRMGITDYGDYYRRIRDDRSGVELGELIHAITTHVTHFFREPHHFQFIAQQLRAWEAENRTPIRIWSAACATGEEPYSLAMTAREAIHDVTRIKILATDISTHVLREAHQGEFMQSSIKDMSPERQANYFRQVRTDRTGAVFQLDPGIIRMVTFAPMNLADIPYPMRSTMDLILCRNVMIYFDNDLRKRILEEMFRLLKPSGYLLVGHAESLSGMLGSFTAVAPSIYTKARA